ncbi:hypothetical protein HJA89_10145 [Rhizobium bangladeshense]|uniref:hypothetical protein n=1 Tax=Rhizobium TaxID=379 RepID=UPI001C83BE23|nr:MULTISPECIES: hypothetical protein [Rhizobium]MBX4873261.1 hypothetical protein [Rhizobium bangladeshense]MBX4884638.1 hypothetical protein [Rhizobium bangladeshense]MBX5146351.1 hypothetical protein [Rhizobium lentis]
MSRWIRLQTSIFDHELFAGKEFSERDAWVWLIARAAWRETRHRVGKEMIIVPAGSLFATLRELQAVWRWGSDFRVRSFLKLLQTERMIIVNSNAGKTQITICNYTRYQNPDQEENAPETQDTRAENAPDTHGKRTKDTNNTNLPKFERERGRESDSDFDGFQEWFATWPASLTDDDDAAFSQWSKLSAEQRAAVKVETPKFIDGVKASGRKNAWPTAARFLERRMWERVGQKPQTKPKRDTQSGITAIAGGITGVEDRAGARPTPKTPEEIKAERHAARVAYLKEAIENNRRQG